MRNIIVDLFGADCGPEPIMDGTVKALRDDDSFGVIIVGSKTLIDSKMPKDLLSRVQILETDDFITNHDAPTCVLKGKENASMVMALDHLKKDDSCFGMVSAGNTGALMVGSIFRLGLIKGLKQPALASLLPTKASGGYVPLLDSGASLECRPIDLVRFAQLGNLYSQCLNSIEHPRIGLLSVGREPGKGTELVKETHKLLQEMDLNFIGNIEGSDISEGVADVVVTDGFTGNVVLKNYEYVGKHAVSILDALAEKEGMTEALSEIRKQLFFYFDLNSRGGANFLGAKKIIIKMHGAATEKTVSSCIQLAKQTDNGGYISRLKDIQLV